MIILSPKARFLANDEQKKAYSLMAGSGLLQDALIHALSELSLSGATTEQMIGAKRFVDLLLNLAEPERPSGQMPAKTLKTY